jgi:secondary thiamine-phosphate synthase enzyme
MKQAFHTIRVSTSGPGLYEVTGKVVDFIREQKIHDGLLTCYIRHTSASLLIQENADPDVQRDLKDFFAQLAKRGMDYRHTAEGPDDMPSHIRGALTQTSIGIPVHGGKTGTGHVAGLICLRTSRRAASPRGAAAFYRRLIR